MNLWEGNAGEEFQSDGYHGSVSYQTLLRNWIHGMSTNATPYRKMIDLDRFSYYFNVVGNILGSPSWSAGSSTTYEMTGSPDYLSQPCIYRLGYPNMGNNSFGAGGGNLSLCRHLPGPDRKINSDSGRQLRLLQQSDDVGSNNYLRRRFPTAIFTTASPHISAA